MEYPSFALYYCNYVIFCLFHVFLLAVYWRDCVFRIGKPKKACKALILYQNVRFGVFPVTSIWQAKLKSNQKD